MLPDNPPGSHLSRLFKGDIVVIPGGAHHARILPFAEPQHTGNEIAHAIHQPDPCPGRVLQTHLHRFVGHEFGLGGHDGASRAALGNFIHGPGTAVIVLHAGKHKQFHEPLDKRRFAGAHRANDAHIYVAAAPARDIPVQCILIHGTRLLNVFSFSDYEAVRPVMLARHLLLHGTGDIIKVEIYFDCPAVSGPGG